MNSATALSRGALSVWQTRLLFLLSLGRVGVVAMADLARHECLRIVAPSHRRTSGRVAPNLVNLPWSAVLAGFPRGRRSLRFLRSVAAACAKVSSSSSLHRALCPLFRGLFTVFRTRARTGIQGFEPCVGAWSGAIFTPLAELASPVGFWLSRVLPQSPCFGFRRCSPLALGRTAQVVPSPQGIDRCLRCRTVTAVFCCRVCRFTLLSFAPSCFG